MRAYNMVNTAGCYAINTGGQVKAFSDKGTTQEVVWKEQPEKAWQRKEREMAERARTYYPSPRESALERELWNQMTGHNRTAVNVSPKLAAEYAAHQAQMSKVITLEKQLMNQLIDAETIERQRMIAEAEKIKNAS